MARQEDLPALPADCSDLIIRVIDNGYAALETTRQQRDYWHCTADHQQWTAEGLREFGDTLVARNFDLQDRIELLQYGLIAAGVALLLVLFLMQRMMNRWRFDRYAARQLHELGRAAIALDRNGVAKYQAAIERLTEDAQTFGDKLWIRRPPALDLPTLQSAGIAARDYIEETLKPINQVAIRGEELKQNIRYETAAFVREVKRLAIVHQQTRWEQGAKEITQLRKVLEAAVAELVHNPALEGRLDYILQRMMQFSTFMEEARDQAKIDESALGQLADSMLTKAFEVDIDRIVGVPSNNGGLGARPR